MLENFGSQSYFIMLQLSKSLFEGDGLVSSLALLAKFVDIKVALVAKDSPKQSNIDAGSWRLASKK